MSQHLCPLCPLFRGKLGLPDNVGQSLPENHDRKHGSNQTKELLLTEFY